MKRRWFRDLAGSLSALDPAGFSYPENVENPETSMEGRAALLDRILAEPPDALAAQPGLVVSTRGATAEGFGERVGLSRAWPAGFTRRFVLVAAGTAVAVGAGVAGVVTVMSTGSPAYATTPKPLSYRLPPNPPTAADMLQRLAAVAERAPEAPGTGDYEYLKSQAWNLDISYQEYSKSFTWKIRPEEEEFWWRPDGSGRTDIRVGGEPKGDPAVYYAPGALPRGPLAVYPVPSDPKALEALLGSTGTVLRPVGPTSVIGNISMLAHHAILAPEVRAGILRMLAARDDITYSGQTVDRSGRHGEAFSWEGDVPTGKVRDTVVVSPADGMPLGYERVQLTLTGGAYDETLGRLLGGPSGNESWPPPRVKIDTPAVVEYSLFLAAEKRELPPPNDAQRAEMVWPDPATPSASSREPSTGSNSPTR